MDDGVCAAGVGAGVMLLIVVIVSSAVSLALTAVLSRTNRRLARLDEPNERSLHRVAAPRTGGLAILAGAATAVVPAEVWLGADQDGIWVGAAAGLVAIVSFLDDRHPLPPFLRLGVHLFAAFVVTMGSGLAAPLSAGQGLPVVVAMSAVVVTIAWSANLYNFMDGMDGFAGGMAVIGFGTCGWLAWRADALVLAVICLSIAAAAAGFLVFNFPPARIFMGDAGATTVGFLMGTVAFIGIRDRVWPWPVPLLVFSPFAVDATVTLARRLLAGDAVWRPHRTHFYQRLVQLGWGHRRTVLWEYVVMLGCAITAIIALRGDDPPWRAIGAIWLATYIVLMGVIVWSERHHLERAKGHS